MRRFLLVSALAALSACATPLRQPAPATSYSNPVIDSDFPDPAVMRAADGHFYVYATQGGEPMRNIQVARSADLVTWQMLGDALPTKPSWASRTQDFWAPDVHSAGGSYYLYYSAKPDAALSDQSRGLCLAVATSASPVGPFLDSGRPLQCGEGFVNIDPFAYDDPATGRKLLYWGSGFGPIKVQELADDRMSFKRGSKPVDLVPAIKSEDPGEYQRLVEGAWVARRDGYYYLFYSGDNCCGPKAHYAVMVARSRSATGPFELRPRPLYLVVEAGGRWVAPGHNAVVENDRGEHWIVYHGVDRQRPRGKAIDDVNTRRVMLMDRLVWREGWREVAGKQPSSGLQAGPAIRRTGR
ncbi:glycoside hydrolase family 43 protein [Sphingomonas sp. GCM10030256]|uniref:glycoside hydrolase family 43 protein n=1 Tax=Sphingomonas sp. GCM10030256 TaxID=3273427 RepID=UPI003616C6C1